ncbi:hypothetical protein HNY73_020787 [Argiope bruennichi]|uniref:Uncharacterized protein n=1 Tax=Argiope bruennichi TaxID=94029 RepID=A0A8T0E821_ARGBR|nr:hypothetical protein HNY73_020787 [Argiope bruennichi]
MASLLRRGLKLRDLLMRISFAKELTCASSDTLQTTPANLKKKTVKKAALTFLQQVDFYANVLVDVCVQLFNDLDIMDNF